MTDAMTVDLTGQVALVTGATRGLGREIAGAIARAGADLVIVSCKPEACEQVGAELTAATGARTLAYACNVGNWDELDGLVETAYARFGRVDVLVNNAGMSPLYPSLVEVTEALYDKVLAVNLKGPFRLTALIGDRMARGAGGSIINISSNAAVRPESGLLPYAAAKSALNTLTTGFARAYGPKVRVVRSSR